LKTAAALWSLVLGLALAEGVARFWLVNLAGEDAFRRFASIEMLRERTRGEAGSLSLYVPHRYLGYVPAPGYRRDRNHHDALGFRGGSGPVPKPPGEFRIACLGGSTTYGSTVEAPEEAYPAQLEAELRRRTHENIRVVNAGASGWASLESLINLETRVLDLDPDLVVVYDNINDVLGRMVWPPSAYRGDQSGSLLHSAGLDAGVPWPQQLTLVRIFLVATGRIRSHLDLAESLGRIAPTQYYFHFVQQKVAGSYPSGLFRKVPAEKILAANPPVYFRRNLESLVAVARAHGVVPVLATFAWSEKVSNDPSLTSPEIVAAMREQNEVVRAIGRERQVPVYDFAAEMPDDPSLFVGALHMTVEGSRVQARLFADFLLREGLVPTRD
jgi:GDSL-like lipase/acylhydrolase family protein